MVPIAKRKTVRLCSREVSHSLDRIVKEKGRSYKFSITREGSRRVFGRNSNFYSSELNRSDLTDEIKLSVSEQPRTRTISGWNRRENEAGEPHLPTLPETTPFGEVIVTGDQRVLGLKRKTNTISVSPLNNSIFTLSKLQEWPLHL